jgi:hypothetical protein
VDFRTDIYSLGVMAYLLATGVYPFTSEQPLAVLHQHLNIAPPLPSDVNPSLPPEMDVVLLRGLAKLREERYESAGALAGEFSRAVQAKPHVVTRVDTMTMNPKALGLVDQPNTVQFGTVPQFAAPQIQPLRPPTGVASPVVRGDDDTNATVPQSESNANPPQTLRELAVTWLIGVSFVLVATMFLFAVLSSSAKYNTSEPSLDTIIQNMDLITSVVREPELGQGIVVVVVLRAAYVLGGITLLLAGERSYRVALNIIGLIIGTTIGMGIAGGADLPLRVLAVVGIALFMAGVFNYLHRAALALAGGYVSMLIVGQMVDLNSGDFGLMTIAAIYGVSVLVGSALTLVLSRETMLALTAALGAVMMVGGLGLIDSELALLWMGLLFAFGVIVQVAVMRTFNKNPQKHSQPA